jgi:hypothetical protein
MFTLPSEPVVWTLLIMSTAIAVGFVCAAADVPANLARLVRWCRG